MSNVLSPYMAFGWWVSSPSMSAMGSSESRLQSLTAPSAPQDARQGSELEVTVTKQHGYGTTRVSVGDPEHFGIFPSYFFFKFFVMVFKK